MAKNKNFLTLLVGALGVVAAVNLFFAANYNLTYLKLRRTQPTLILATNMRNQMNAVVQMLAGELLEYSKRNPSIDPVLASFNIKPAPTNATTARPTKP